MKEYQKKVQYLLFLDGEAAEMDKRTVLDLCNHMFHGKEEVYDT